MLRSLAHLCRLPSKRRPRARRRRMATLAALSALCLLLIVPLYAIYKPPAFLLRRLARRYPDVLWQVDENLLPRDPESPPGDRSAGPQKLVALTIDDAPSEQTAEILSLLRQHGARATFFVIGAQAEGDASREELLRRAVREGHELGNHAMHDEAARSLDLEELEAQIGHVQGILREAYKAEGLGDGPPHNYFRPGSGFFSAPMRRLVSRLGFRLVLGSIYPHDAQISNWHANARHILSMLRPGRIIICHDRRSWTVPMLQHVLPEARRRGYQFVTVSELVAATDTTDT